MPGLWSPRAHVGGWNNRQSGKSEEAGGGCEGDLIRVA